MTGLGFMGNLDFGYQNGTGISTVLFGYWILNLVGFTVFVCGFIRS